jgi:hypothetical protein
MSNEVMKSEGVSGQMVQARETSMMQARIMMAMKMPRDEKRSYDKIMNACTRESLAESAVYEYSRGGTSITGPSIRLAEAMAQYWGNIDSGVNELEQANGESTVEAFAWDLETNTRISKTFKVPHIRYSKEKGNTRLTDPRDIYEMIANNAARRQRACILAVLPGDVVEAAVRQCEVTLNAKGEVTPERIKAMIEKFEKFGVTKEQLTAYCGRDLLTISPSMMNKLIKRYNAIKDGIESAAEVFKQKEPQKRAQAGDILGGAKTSAKPAEPVQPQTEATGSEQEEVLPL